jgi:hypothetical protein
MVMEPSKQEPTVSPYDALVALGRGLDAPANVEQGIAELEAADAAFAVALQGPQKAAELPAPTEPAPAPYRAAVVFLEPIYDRLDNVCRTFTGLVEELAFGVRFTLQDRVTRVPYSNIRQIVEVP